MNVQVRLYALLRRYHPGPDPGAWLKLELPDGATVADVADHLKLPGGIVHAAAVNGESCELDRLLQEGDRVSLFPPAAGGAFTERPLAINTNGPTPEAKSAKWVRFSLGATASGRHSERSEEPLRVRLRSFAPPG